MFYEPPQRARPRRREGALESPVVAVAVVALVLGGVAAVVLVPGILPFGGLGGPGATASQAAGGATATPAGPPPSPTFARPTPSPGPSFLTSVVKRGDSLNSIARRFKTTERSIAWWNRGFYPTLDPDSDEYDPDTIRVGWELNVLRNVEVNEEDPPAPIGTPRETPKD
jgi:hypothetical protein